MEIIIVDDSSQGATLAVNEISATITKSKKPVLGLATGGTPLAIYQKLIDAYQKEKISFKNVTTFNLDEYIGIESSHPQSYRSFMMSNLFDNIDIGIQNAHLPECGVNTDYEKSAHQYENKIIEHGGIDLQLLGLGTNGHIGFNEPSSSLCSRTRVKTLAQSTIDDNKRFFSEGEFQPTLAMTMGIGTILNAKKVLLLAFGKQKAKAVHAVVEGALSASCPGSALQQHNNTIVIVDSEAASELLNREYYYRVSSEKARLLS